MGGIGNGIPGETGAVGAGANHRDVSRTTKDLEHTALSALSASCYADTRLIRGVQIGRTGPAEVSLIGWDIGVDGEPVLPVIRSELHEKGSRTIRGGPANDLGLKRSNALSSRGKFHSDLVLYKVVAEEIFLTAEWNGGSVHAQRVGSSHRKVKRDLFYVVQAVDRTNGIAGDGRDIGRWVQNPWKQLVAIGCGQCDVQVVDQIACGSNKSLRVHPVDHHFEFGKSSRHSERVRIRLALCNGVQ